MLPIWLIWQVGTIMPSCCLGWYSMNFLVQDVLKLQSSPSYRYRLIGMSHCAWYQSVAFYILLFQVEKWDLCSSK
jgi:alpha-galactosidase/6-phospho-beta-glucosidase family protein